LIDAAAPEPAPAAPEPDGIDERRAAVDSLVASLWPALDGVALTAVGGYGRGELFPFSDVDLLIVTSRTDLREPLAPFIRDLWDAGLRISQSIHTVEECLAVDDTNIELSVSLLDRRFLLGDRALFDRLRDPPRERLTPALAKLTRERHAANGNTIYHLEPNVKDVPGGIRDLHVIRWLARLDGNALTVPPHSLLFRIRTLLHEEARRDQNVLGYLMQDVCAARLGFPDPADLMRAYYREAAPIHRASLRRLDETETRRSSLFAGFRERAARLSNADFSVVGGRVYFRVPPSGPEVLVRLFEFLARHGLPLSRDAEDRAAAVETAAVTWSELRTILDLPHAGHAVRAMHNTGFLVRLFPETRGIESLVVRDFYHRYTVDEHTLVAIETAVKLRTEKDRFGDLARETADYPLLLIALLFHDAGKGVPHENHSIASEEIAARAFEKLGMGAAEAVSALFLIRCHLEMSRIMTTRDLSDPETAAAVTRSVGTSERLKLLTLLTYCDISAVNPTALTPWRATLLWRLYLACARHLTHALQNEIAEEGMPARYGLTHSPEEIAEHRRMEAEGRTVRLQRSGTTYRMDVVSADRTFLFADIAGALAGFGMNILRAESFSNQRHVAIESFTFADPMRTLELNPEEFDRLERIVAKVISGERRVEDLLRARVASRRTGDQAPRVSFDNSASARATLFEITAEDRPGLLYDLARSISASACNIEVVLVDTQGHKAIDVFYVTRDGQALDDAAAGMLRDQLTGAV
jgi:[protein-PII] uridylyltransferase